ncbi:MAG: ferrous iron transport protein A [Candidatus Aminicenantes bacterium]|jgi:Fe2+ transport system protein FeoA|nr:ferrous iron transport protein A [Candidatus Aminicenantes bacterium]
MFGKRSGYPLNEPELKGSCTLLEIPQGAVYKIVEIRGGPGLHRRLLSLGFHRGDLITLEGEAIMKGPVLVRNLNNDTRVALGRGIAQKILVEPVGSDER